MEERIRRTEEEERKRETKDGLSAQKLRKSDRYTARYSIYCGEAAGEEVTIDVSGSRHVLVENTVFPDRIKRTRRRCAVIRLLRFNFSSPRYNLKPLKASHFISTCFISRSILIIPLTTK